MNVRFWPPPGKNSARRVFIIATVGFLLLTTYYLLPTNVIAFTGPSTAAGIGGGALRTDSGSNLSVGSSPSANTKFLLQAPDASSSNYSLRILQQDGITPMLLVRNDGKVAVGTTPTSTALTVGGSAYFSGTVTATTFSGSLTGTVSAANVSSGQFGANTSGGEYYFPGNVGIGTTNPTELLYLSSSNGINLQVGGQSILGRFKSSGSTLLGYNVKVTTGTNNQMERLTGDATISDYAILMGGTNGQGGIQFHTKAASSDAAGTVFSSERMRITDNGNVGIGTTGPTSLLDVQAATSIIRVKSTTGTNSATLRFDNTGGAAQFGLNNSAGNVFSGNGVAYSTFISSAGTNPIQFGVNDSVAVTIINGGNIGIGTTSPGETLAIGQNTAGNDTAYSLAIRRNGISASPGTWDTGVPALTIFDWAGDGPASLDTNGPLLYVAAGKVASTDTNAANALIMWVRNDDAVGGLAVNGNGNVGIGTTNPGQKLVVSSGNILLDNTADQGIRALRGSDSAAGNILFTQNGNSGNLLADATEVSSIGNSPIQLLPNGGANSGVTILSSGNVGIGTTGPGYKLEVNGSAAKPGGGSWSDSSDARLKTNIRPLNGALAEILQLQPVSFEWRNPDLHGGIQKSGGFLAQDVMRVFPQWVSQIDASGADTALVGPDGKTYSLTLPTEFDALTVGAIKELYAENQALKERVRALESRR